MERRIDVSTGIADHGDRRDREAHTRSVVRVRVFTPEVRPDLGRREPGVGLQAVLDRMAEIDERRLNRHDALGAAAPAVP